MGKTIRRGGKEERKIWPRACIMFSLENGWHGEEVPGSQAHEDFHRFSFAKLRRDGAKVTCWIHSNRWYEWEVGDE